MYDKHKRHIRPFSVKPVIHSEYYIKVSILNPYLFNYANHMLISHGASVVLKRGQGQHECVEELGTYCLIPSWRNIYVVRFRFVCGSRNPKTDFIRDKKVNT